MARLAAGATQEGLAEVLGVTFQQVQKYEKGVNRIGPGRLHVIANFLHVPITFFFEGAGPRKGKQAEEGAMQAITDALSTREGVRIALALSRIKDGNVRQRIADLLEAMVEDEREGVRAAR